MFGSDAFAVVYQRSVTSAFAFTRVLGCMLGKMPGEDDVFVESSERRSTNCWAAAMSLLLSKGF